MAERRTHTVIGGGGVRLHVEETGNRGGPAVLFIHGYSQCRLAWRRQMDSDLAADLRLVALDNRGHGLSEKPRHAYADSRLWAELIGLSLFRYYEEARDPPLPADKLNVNWWTLRMVEEFGEVDEDFEALERKKPLVSFTTANNRAARSRSNSKTYDDFALVEASQAEFAENQSTTPQFEQEEVMLDGPDEDITPRNTPKPNTSVLAPSQLRPSPVITTTYRGNAILADMPPAPTISAVSV